jgi:dipeptidyl aminopeptidase/acylaminoacyl peptidase
VEVDGRHEGVGVLVKPVGFQAGKKYPLIVAIHGGPAAADMLSFNGGLQLAGVCRRRIHGVAAQLSRLHAVRREDQIESQGDYFTKGFQDIMTGVDFLISQQLVDSTKMGALGWSAGGHYSNWIEGHTNRFKAISSGAGVANWISMWSQSDTQRLRQWYVGDKMYWETPTEYQNWWKQSPIAYIKNAKTPMFIHVGRRRSARAEAAE